MKKCPNCGAQIDDNSLFCAECGKQIPQGNVCSNCGALVNDGDTFCQNCGSKVERGDGQQTSSVTAPEQKHCPHCGAIVSIDSLFCESCGKNVSDGNSTPNTNFPPQTPNATGRGSQNKFVLPIIIGLLVLALAGGWWYYKSSNSLQKGNTAVMSNETSADSIVSTDTNSKEYITNYLNEIFPKAIKMSEKQAIEKYFTKEFADLYRKVEVCDSVVNANGDIGFWDFEFWTGGQDGELASIKVLDISDLDQSRATALVQYVIKFGAYDESKTSNSLYLVFEEGKWLIDDLNSYKDRFEDYLGSANPSNNENNQQSSDNPNAKYVGAWSLYINSEGQRVRVYTAVINQDMTCEFISYLSDGSINGSVSMKQCVFRDGYVFFTDNGDITIKGTPRFRLGSSGLQSADGINMVRE